MDESLHPSYSLPALPDVTRIAPLQPLHWLKLGWEDLRHHPGPGIAHGLLLVGIGWLILLFCSAHVDLMAAAVSAYVIVGPLFGAAFYEMSRLRAAGAPVSFDASLAGALGNGRRLASLGGVLALLAIAWVVVSGLLFSGAFGAVPPSLDDVFYWRAFDWNYAGFFAIYLGTGAILALVAFAVSAVSAPMLFDRPTDTSAAVLTSVRAVAVNPAAMAVWAVLIALLTAIGFATFLFGLALVLPWLGHATWHAYRDLVAWPE